MEKHSIYIDTRAGCINTGAIRFIPQNFKIKEECAYYAGKFRTVEINSTF